MSVENKTSILSRYEPEEIQELQDVFQFFDKEGEGHIKLDELIAIMRNMGQFPTKDELTDALQQYHIESDANGTFGFEDFVKLMASRGSLHKQLSHEEEEKELRDAFTLFDKRGCGYIGVSDILGILQCMGEEVTEEMVSEMIDEVDINGDGRIDYDEFIACVCMENTTMSVRDEVRRASIGPSQIQGLPWSSDRRRSSTFSDKSDGSDKPHTHEAIKRLSISQDTQPGRRGSSYLSGTTDDKPN